MSALPGGTVTFLFTDIEGSTPLWERNPEAMKFALARHNAILRQAIESHHGYVFNIVGDSFHAAFVLATQALAAALAAQHALVWESWGETGPLQVRVGLHTGLAEPLEHDYASTHTLNLVARVMSAAYGGQILLSQATAGLVRRDLPLGVSLKDLGEHRLKGLSHPEHLFQVVGPDLRQDFPLLPTRIERPNNLPPQLTSFVGREAEIAAICEKLLQPEVRLLTLTGVGGTGKTRLSLQVGQTLLETFPDGVFFVPLDLVREVHLVIPSIAKALGLRESPVRSPFDFLKEYLTHKQLLLILDTFEQIFEAGPALNELLAAAPKIKVLVTSRTLLRLAAEHDHPVSPLSLPDMKDGVSMGNIEENEAVQLFVQRAQAAKPDFQLNAQNAVAVAEICRRLDGLPLAIELAAARIKVLSPQALLARLDSRLKLLTGGARDLPAKQQTLRNSIGWSYDLLEEGEKVLFRRLAVFAGGCTLDAAEALCNAPADPEMDILERMASLVDKSLLRQGEGVEGEPRFWMLETIREYARERLVESGEAAAIQRRHADLFLALAEKVEPQLRSGEREIGLRQLEAEHDNLRAALAWSQTADEGEICLRMAGSLSWFWYLGGHWSEGRGWLESALALTEAGSSMALRVKAVLGVGILAAGQGNSAVARPRLQESTAQFRKLGDKRGLAYALAFLGLLTSWHDDPTVPRSILEESVALFQELGDQWGLALALGFLGNTLSELNDYEAAQSHAEHSVALFRELGDKWGLTLSLMNRGHIALRRRDDAAARSWLEESLAISRGLGDTPFIALLLVYLGNVLRHQGDFERAAALYEEGLALYRDAGSKWGMAVSLHNLGRLAWEQGDYRQAAALFEESLPLYRETGYDPGVVGCLAGLAGIAGSGGQPERAARLLGAAQALMDSTNAVIGPEDRLEIERDLSAVRSQLSEEAFAVALEQGRAMTMEQAIAYALVVDA